jgi:hypothetical protein
MIHFNERNTQRPFVLAPTDQHSGEEGEFPFRWTESMSGQIDEHKS